MIMPDGEVENPMRTIITPTIINSNIDIRKINRETFFCLVLFCFDKEKFLCCLFTFRGPAQHERESVLL